MLMFAERSDADRFGKFIRLLASDNDGERAAAARKATDFLKSKGLDWHAVVDALSSGRSPRQPRHPRPESEPYVSAHNAAAQACLSSGIAWKSHEMDFLTQMAARPFPPTEKQKNWLAYLVSRCAAHKAGAA